MPNDQNSTPVPSESLPPNTLIVPYHLSTLHPYEHEFARFADKLWEKRPDLVTFTERSTTLDGEAIAMVYLKNPILAWCLDTNATQLCTALMVHWKHSPVSIAVWMIDGVEFASKVWKITATPKTVTPIRGKK